MVFDWTGGLRDNPCWPIDMATGDPGYAILTDDKWYDGPWIPAADKAQRPQYRLAPSEASFNAAVRRKFAREFPDETFPGDGIWPWPLPLKRSLDGGDEGLQRLTPLMDGGFALRGANSSRRLTDEERRSIEEELGKDANNVVECDDPSGGKEIKAFGRGGVVIPVVAATTLATVPSTNLDARPTEVPGEPPRQTTAYTDAERAERAETTVDVPVETGRHRHRHRHHRHHGHHRHHHSVRTKSDSRRAGGQ
ncbi:glycoside hydrolase family 18 protein [Colletotrichum sojae]|uniref:Glycoside hydrolase family 18 protein n=1 Tax=Colletotrichum sojae TaxID=2175907 RepID=A0A8H6ITV7_9PEZI|nr:glycoside hydrolase family 18 protein [Colletotrichum sojae]